VRHTALILGLALTLPCFSEETIYLTTGFSFQAQSHVVQGSSIVIYTASGTLEFPQSQVARIEADETTAASAAPSTHPKLSDLLRAAATSEGLEPELVESVARVESGLRPDAVSPKGAIGLMQLLPATMAELGAVAPDAGSNALAGSQYLRELLIRYHGDYVLALAAYNAGCGAVAKYHGVPPYAETVQYILKVLREYQREKGTERAQNQQRLNTPNARD
jgi:soluble lytic murein transglycosylase-like protein